MANVVKKHSISSELAQKMVDRVMAKARELGVAENVAILDDGGNLIYAGEPAGLIIRMPGGFTIYHSGDTCVFGDMKLIAELYKPDVAMLPIGDNFTMGPKEAAHATRLLGIKHVIPMHYGTFPPLVGTPDQFKSEAKDIAGLEIHVMQPGDVLG